MDKDIALKPKSKDNGTLAPVVLSSAAAGTVAIAGGVISHREKLDKIREQSLQVKHTSHRSFVRSLKPGDILVQGYGRYRSGDLGIPNPVGGQGSLIKGVKVKTSDAVQAFHGYPELHAGVYVGKGKFVHSTGHGDKVRKGNIGDLTSRSNVVAIRPKTSSQKRARAAEYATQQIGKPYTPKSHKNIVKELVGLKTKYDPNCKDFVCTSLPMQAYHDKAKSMYEHPYEMVHRGQAKIVSSHNTARLGATENIASTHIHPIVSSLKYAVPAAAMAGIAAHFLSKKNTDKS